MFRLLFGDYDLQGMGVLYGTNSYRYTGPPFMKSHSKDRDYPFDGRFAKEQSEPILKESKVLLSA